MPVPNPIHEARRHYLCALYRSVFVDRRKNTNIICWSKHYSGEDGVADHEAQILVRHRMALIRVSTDGIAYLTATTTGARKSNQNRTLVDSRGRGVLSHVPHGPDTPPVDMAAVADACIQHAYKFTVNSLY